MTQTLELPHRGSCTQRRPWPAPSPLSSSLQMLASRGSRTQSLLQPPPASSTRFSFLQSCGGWGRSPETRGERGRAESAGCRLPFPGSPGPLHEEGAESTVRAAGPASRLRAEVPVRAEGDGVTLAAVTPFGEGGRWSDGKHPVLCRRGGVLPGNPRSVGQEARAWRAAGRGGV